MKKYAIWVSKSPKPGDGYWIYENSIEEVVTCNNSLGEEVEVFEVKPLIHKSIGKYKAELVVKQIKEKNK